MLGDVSLGLHLIYLHDMLLIPNFFVDHGFVDDALAEEDAFKDGYWMHHLWLVLLVKMTLSKSD